MPDSQEARSAAKIQELAEAAARLKGIGHGLRLDEPVNVGSLGWANGAMRILDGLAALKEDA